MEDSSHDNVKYMLINQPKGIDQPPPLSPSSFQTRPPRLVKRSNGRPLIKYKNLPAVGWLGYISDGFTTLVNARWYIIILIFTLMYCVSWLIFGFLWWGVDWAYKATGNSSCISNSNDFAGSFLFSLETQVTIGYGHRFVSDSCSFGIFLLIVQCIVGLLIDSFLLGLVFSKITRPRNRRKTLLFSDQAVIYEVDGKKYFEFRIADIRKSSLVEAHVRVQAYWYKDVESTGTQVLYESDIDVGYDTGRDRVILLTPVTVRHCITETSPLYSLTSENILAQDLEIVVVLEAIIESTGLTAQALWSYTEEEIMYGYKFVPMTYRDMKGDHSWEVDFDNISHVSPVRSFQNNDL